MLDSPSQDELRSVVYGINGDDRQKQLVEQLADALKLDVQYCDTVEEMLSHHDGSRPACVVTDICQLVADSPLRASLEEERENCPVVVLSGHQARLAFETLAQDGLCWLKQPYDHQRLREAVQKALEVDTAQREKCAETRAIQSQLAQLTPDEKTVLSLILQGKVNKQMAKAMDVSKRTVENRRRSLNTKLGVESVAELVLKVAKAGDAALRPDPPLEAEQRVPQPKLATRTVNSA